MDEPATWAMICAICLAMPVILIIGAAYRLWEYIQRGEKRK